MDFGVLDPSDLLNVDFSLPVDGNTTVETLQAARKDRIPSFYVGCPKWADDNFRGTIFPKKLHPNKMLSEYTKHFNTVETNAVFYSIPKPDLIRKWHSEVKNENFLFCPKISRQISHLKSLDSVNAELEQFLSAVSEFRGNLGPIFIQLGDNFAPTAINRETLETFLRKLPTNLRFFIELRHKDWFANPLVRKEIFALLKELNIGAVISDTAGRRDVVHLEVPIPEVMIRFVGYGSRHLEKDFARINKWVERLKSWKGLQRVYFFVHQVEVQFEVKMVDGAFSSSKITKTFSNDATLPLIDYVIKQFNQHLGADLQELVIPPKGQQELF